MLLQCAARILSSLSWLTFSPAATAVAIKFRTTAAEAPSPPRPHAFSLSSACFVPARPPASLPWCAVNVSSVTRRSRHVGWSWPSFVRLVSTDSVSCPFQVSLVLMLPHSPDATPDGREPRMDPGSPSMRRPRNSRLSFRAVAQGDEHNGASLSLCLLSWRSLN